MKATGPSCSALVTSSVRLGHDIFIPFKLQYYCHRIIYSLTLCYGTYYKPDPPINSARMRGSGEVSTQPHELTVQYHELECICRCRIDRFSVNLRSTPHWKLRHNRLHPKLLNRLQIHSNEHSAKCREARGCFLKTYELDTAVRHDHVADSRQRPTHRCRRRLTNISAIYLQLFPSFTSGRRWASNRIPKSYVN